MNEPIKTETKRYQCRHIFNDGHRCGSICLRGEPFCYYHHTTRKPAPRQSFGRKASFDLPLPEDRSAIQASLGIILQKIASNDLDSKRAGLLLYGLQIASLNLPKQKEEAEEPVHEITTDPELGTLAPESEIVEHKSSIALLLERFTNPKPPTLPTNLPQEHIGLIVAGGHLDAAGSGPNLEKCLNGLGSPTVLPVGVGAGPDGERERSPALPVESIDRSPAADESLDSSGPGTPRSDMQSCAVAGDLEVAITAVESICANAEFEQPVNPFYVAVAGELGQPGTALR